jgi:hypothetical protein
MYCEACGQHPAARHVVFHQNVGLLIIRLSKSIRGDLCGGCIHKYFWEFTAINLLLGWWGIISFIVTPFLVLNNLLYYAGMLGSKSPQEREERRQVAAAPASTRSLADDKNACYLCGKPLAPDESSSRICRACQA